MAFVLGFCTSFGWWTAGKIQKAIDSTVVINEAKEEAN
jgi:hypothetical protein